MVEKFKLKLEARQARTPNQLRQQGKIPATVYGRGVESKSVQVDAREFSRLPAAAFSHVVELVGEADGQVSALVRNVQRRSTTHEVLNIEFYRVQADRKLTVSVPLKFTGTSPAVKLGGQLIEFHHEVEVECLPADIPDSLEVDLEQITQLDEGIHFSDLKVPDGVEILNPADEIVVRVATPRAVEEVGKAEVPAEGEAAAPAEGAAPTPAAAGAPAGKEKEKE